MQIKRMKLDKLRPAAYNPRIALKPGDPEFERLKNSIETFGNVEPIVWNKRTGNVVGGHQRLAVLKELGEKETDVSIVDLTAEDEKLLNIALNKIKGEWDYDRLTDLLKQFEPDEAKLSGFSPQEIAILCADANAAAQAAIEEVAPVEDYDDGDDFDGHANTGTGAGAGNGSGVYDFDGASWVVSLVFPDIVTATDWLIAHGYDAARPGTRSTVIRVE